MKLIRGASSAFDHLINFLSLLSAALVSLIAITVVSSIIMRYFFRTPLAGAIEVSEYALLFMTFLGAAWVLKMGGHVKMDLLSTRLRPRTVAFINIITSVLSAVLWLVIAWYGIKVTLLHFQIDYFIRAGIDTPSFITLAVIPVGSFILSVQIMRSTRQYWSTFRSKPNSDAVT